MALIDDAGNYIRRAVMLEAHRAFGLRRDKGMSFADALKFAWAMAHTARDRRRAELIAFERYQQRWAA